MENKDKNKNKNEEMSVDEKVEKLRSIVKKNTSKQIIYDDSIYGLAKIQEHRAKKAKARKRNKIQKASKKANRKK